MVVALAISYALIAQAQSNLNSSVSVKKQTDGNGFAFTIADPEGIEAFSFQPAKSSAYGGGLNCPTKFSNNNVQFIDPEDFDPAMKVSITDCKKNVAEFEIGPLKNGAGKGVLTNKPQEETTPIPIPTVAPKSSEKTTAPVTESTGSSKENIQYPVKELGNCTDEKSCRSYCDKPDNYSECFAFAKKNGLLEDDLADKSEVELEEFAQALKKGGPGGCQTQSSCETYCNEASRLNECLVFAEKHNLMKGSELEEAKKVQAVLAGGGSLPGGCKNKKECDAYCGGPDHADECLAFAEKAGFMPPEEIKQARKAMELMARGETPGNCRSKEQCEAYCEGGEHFEECIAFAEKAGFIPPDELAMIKKTGGKGPGGCKGKAQCDAFCQDGNNFEQCVAFAEEHGFMKKEEAEMARKTGGKGPGDCKGREECEAFCQNPNNQETCFNFAKDKGLLSEDDLKRMEEGRQSFSKALGEAPPEVRECLDALGIREGMPPTRDVSKQMDECFRSAFQGQGGPGGGSPGGPGGGFSGPGGCTNPEECQAFCEENPEECQGSGPPGGGPGGNAGGFTECGIIPGAVAKPVCGINGKGAPPGKEISYFNRCHAEQSRVQILHEGACNEEECPGIADPVCGNDGSNWTSPCAAKKDGGGVKHKGICTEEDFGGSEGSGEHSQERSAQAHSEDVSRQMSTPSLPPTGSGGPPLAPDQQYQQQFQQEIQQQYQQQYPQPPQEYQQPPEGQTPPPPPPTSYQLRGSLMAQMLGLLVNLLGIR